MAVGNKWLRVNRQNRCPICDHFDWCVYSPELKLAICMRITSERPAKSESGGYLHPLNGEHRPKYVKREETPKVEIDATKLMAEFAQDTVASHLESFSESLGVSSAAIRSIGCQRAKRYSSWAFPMFDAAGEIIGIRLRRDDGTKFAVTGSRQGLFMSDKSPSKTAYIVEGASDLSALISMGLWGIGRPSCLGCISTITATLSRLNVRRVVIIADNDDPGINGSAALVKELDIPSVVFIPPAKDLRQAFSFGLTVPVLESLVNSQVWVNPKPRVSLLDSSNTFPHAHPVR